MAYFYVQSNPLLAVALATVNSSLRSWGSRFCSAFDNVLTRGGGRLRLLALLLLLSNTLLAQDWNQIIKTAASDRRTLTSAGRSAGDTFGYLVAIDGDYAVVGAYTEDEDASGVNTLTDAGSAIVFRRVNGTWTQIKKLVASDRAANDNFGFSVGISGGLIVVGATGEDEDASGNNTLSSAGSAYVFSQNQGGTDNWGQIRKLVASDRGAGDAFGISVAISGSLIVVGAYQEDEDTSGDNTLSSAGSAYVFSQNQGGADSWGQVKKLVASDRAANDQFGSLVAISGSLIVVGAYQEDEDASGGNTLTNAGSAYVFSQNQGGTNNWGQVKKLVASDRAANDQFGISVAISGGLIVVGATGEDEDASGGNTLSLAGSAYVFSQNQGGIDNWGQIRKLVASDRAAGDAFGISVAISGPLIVVGASSEDEDASGNNTLSNAGSAYVFSQNQGGTDNWGQAKKIVASDRAAGDAFGISVAISGSQLVVGAYAEDEDASGGNTLSLAGSAYMFSQSQGGADNWGQSQKVVLSDYVGNQNYGTSVAIDGNYAVVGAPQDYLDAASGQVLLNAGSAYVLTRQNGTWTQIKKLVASDRAANDNFGKSVAISGGLIVVGAYQESEDASGGNTLSGSGSAYVFSQNLGGTDNWGQVKKVAPSDRATNDQFGVSVAISGSQLVVGAYQETEDASGGNMLIAAGSAYVFSQNQGGADNWGQVKKIVPSDRAIGDFFGYSVAISGSQIVVGAYGKNDILGNTALSAAGSAYVFSQNQGGANNWGQVKKLVISDRVTNDSFGWSVAISGGQIVVGAFGEDQDELGNNTLAEAGSAYVFSQNQGGADNWGQVKKLVASDRAANDYFGYSVAVSGSQLVVGALQEDEDASGANTLANTGSAYFFESTGVTLAGFTTTSSPVCAGSVATFTATVGNVTGAYDFTLTNGSSTTTGTTASTPFSQSWTATGSGTQSFTLTVSTSGQNATASTTLTVNTLPSVSITTNPLGTAGAVTLTAGGAVTLTALGADSYTWSNGSTANSLIVTNVTSATTLSVTGTTGGCSATASVAVSVTACSPPTVSLLNTGPGNCYNVASLSVSSSGAIGSLAWYNGGNLVFTSSPQAATAGTTVAGGHGTGSATNQLNTPTSVYVDASGAVYVADQNNNRIQKWAAGATSGSPVAGGNGRGSADNQLDSPAGVYVDASGAVYVADQNNNRIQKWAAGAISGTTVAGGNGQGSAANQLSFPQGVSVDGSGAIYVADAGNNRIQQWAAMGSPVYVPGSAGTYSVVVTTADGCTATTNAIAITNPPSVSITTNPLGTSGAVTLTAGGSVTLTAAGADTYVWSNGSTANPLIVTNVTSATTLSVTGTTGGCSATASVAVSVTANPPSILATTATGTITACQGTASQPVQSFTISASNLTADLVATAPTDFELSTNASSGFVSSVTLAQSSGTIALTTLYMRTASTATVGSKSGNVILSSTNATSQLVAVSATVNALPTPVVTGNLTIYAGQSTTLTASGGSGYAWSTGATSAAITVSPTSTTAYSVTVSNASGCISTTSVSVTALSGPDLTTTINLPDANFPIGGIKGLVVAVQEVNGASASGSIVVTLTVPTGYSVRFDNTLTSFTASGGSGSRVENTNWHQSASVSGQQVSITLNDGQSVGANGSQKLGFSITRTTASSGSVSNITVNVADDSSGSYDVNKLNNVYARIITGL